MRTRHSMPIRLFQQFSEHEIGAIDRELNKEQWWPYKREPNARKIEGLLFKFFRAKNIVFSIKRMITLNRVLYS